LDERVKPIKWSKRATKDLERLSKFYIEIYGNQKAEKILTELRQSTEIINWKNLEATEIGQIDEAFGYLKGTYRKLIKQHCKITYRIGKTKIYIVRIFDTRDDPRKNI
jgi:plasmid stabilization system protein ParE